MTLFSDHSTCAYLFSVVWSDSVYDISWIIKSIEMGRNMTDMDEAWCKILDPLGNRNLNKKRYNLDCGHIKTG